MKLVTPSGFRDILSAEAAERERITREVQDLFAEHGFLPIETPTLEIMDVVSQGARLPSSPFKFFDSKGDLLAMRPDVTLQVARMCATRLRSIDEAIRLRYTQRVFRESDEESSAKPREITQIGVEVIGSDSSDVDLELIELMVQALKVSGVDDITLSLATVAPLRSLLDRSGASDAWKQAVLDAYHGSNFVELAKLTDLDDTDTVDAGNIAPAYADAVWKLSRIRGGKDAIASARDLVSPLGCAEGLDELEAICDSLHEDAKCKILVDFSLISSFDYYTGIVFEAYSPYLGSSLASGGRYDNMLASYGIENAAAGFAFCLEQAMAANTAEDEARANDVQATSEGDASQPSKVPSRKLRIAVPKGSLNKQAIECLTQAGLDTEGLADPGRQLIVSTPDADFIIVRPSDAPAFVAYGAADCGICGRDSLLESGAQVVELADLGFGGCRFVVAEPEGAARTIEERYRKLGSIRVATKYPNITLAHYAKTGVQVDIVKLHGNIELAPLTGMAERIVDITATGTTLKENDLVIVEDVLDSTARFFANPCALRTDARVIELSRALEDNAKDKDYEPIAGSSM